MPMDTAKKPTILRAYLRRHARPARRRHRSLFLVVAATIFIAVVHILHLHFEYRESFRAKYSATKFNAAGLPFYAPEDLFPKSLVPTKLLRSDIDSQYVFQRHLGSGWEGWTQVHRDSISGSYVVIKRFRTNKSPLRNCVPLYLQDRLNGESIWPSELPATLIFGGFHPVLQNGSVETSLGHDFLPIYDYFLSQEDGAPTPEWHLVTPFIQNGTLRDLAKRLHGEQLWKYRDLDIAYRPLFHGLLATLGTMHDRRMCHDDVKPTNILALNSTTWLLGDMGTVREVTHPYHQCRVWKETRRWQDCRINDVYRALISYLKFLREASSNPEEFDREFFGAREPWSRLYWTFYRNSKDPMNVAALLSYSKFLEMPENPPQYVTAGSTGLPKHGVSSMLFGYRKSLEREISTILEGKIHDKFAWLMSLNWLVHAKLERKSCRPLP